MADEFADPYEAVEAITLIDQLEEEYERRRMKKKGNGWRQAQHEQRLKIQGKWKETPQYKADDRFEYLPDLGITIQREYPRMWKPIANIWMKAEVLQMDSSRAMYLQTEVEIDTCKKIQTELASYYDRGQVPSLPGRFIKEGNSCAVLQDGQWYRGRILGVDNVFGVRLWGSDVGKELRMVDIKDLDRLKVLLKAGEHLIKYEQAIHTKIAHLCESVQLGDEKMFLKKLLPSGAKVWAKFDKRNGALNVLRVNLLFRGDNDEKGPCINAVFQDGLLQRGIASGSLDRSQSETSGNVLPVASPRSVSNNGNGAKADISRDSQNSVAGAPAAARSIPKEENVDFGFEDGVSYWDYADDRDDWVGYWVMEGSHKRFNPTKAVGLSVEQVKALHVKSYMEYLDEAMDALERQYAYLWEGNEQSLSTF